MADDFGAGRGTNGRAELGVAVAGAIEEPGDRDFFRVSLEEGRFYEIVLDGARLSELRNTLDLRDFPIAVEGRSLTASRAAGDHLVAVAGSGADLPEGYSLTVTRAAATDGTDQSDYIQFSAAAQTPYAGGGGNDALAFAFHDTPVFVYIYDAGYGEVRDPAGAGSDYGRLTWFTGFERLTGSSQDDTFRISTPSGVQDPALWVRGIGGDDLFQPGEAADLLNGGGGRDTVDYSWNGGSRSTDGAGVTASLFAGRGWSGAAEGDRYRSIENLTGTDRNDVLTGDHGNNVLLGLDGDDILFGNGGSDTLSGSNGQDVAVYGGRRDDYYITVVRERIAAGPEDYGTSIRATVSDQRLGGGDGFDTLYDIEILRFSDGDLIL